MIAAAFSFVLFLLFVLDGGEGFGTGVGEGHGGKAVVLPFVEELGFGLLIEWVLRGVFGFFVVLVVVVGFDSGFGGDGFFQKSGKHVGVFGFGDADELDEAEGEF